MKGSYKTSAILLVVMLLFSLAAPAFAATVSLPSPTSRTEPISDEVMNAIEDYVDAHKTEYTMNESFDTDKLQIREVVIVEIVDYRKYRETRDMKGSIVNENYGVQVYIHDMPFVYHVLPVENGVVIGGSSEPGDKCIDKIRARVIQDGNIPTNRIIGIGDIHMYAYTPEGDMVMYPFSSSDPPVSFERMEYEGLVIGAYNASKQEPGMNGSVHTTINDIPKEFIASVGISPPTHEYVPTQKAEVPKNDQSSVSSSSSTPKEEVQPQIGSQSHGLIYWVGGGVLLVALAAGGVWFIRKKKGR